MPGAKPEELNDAINAVWATFDDPVAVCRDGSNYDSHQDVHLIEQIDLQLLGHLRPLLAHMGFDLFEARAIMKAMKSTRAKITVPAPKGRSSFGDRKKPTPLITLELEGTTFSGHPLRTTLGNTIRTLETNYGMARKYGFL
jgi:hypothetical protein